MPKKSWDTFVPPRDEPIEFALNGRTFHCADEIPAGAFRALSSWSTTTGAALDFIECCLRTDELVQAWREITADRTRPVPKETVLEIMQWLTEKYTLRPTLSPSDSAPGPQATSNGSVGDSSPSAEVLTP